MQTAQDKKLFELSDIEFRQIYEKLKAIGEETGLFRLECSTGLTQFTMNDGAGNYTTVWLVCHNLTGGPHAGKDAGIRVRTLGGRDFNWLAVMENEAFVGWRSIFNGNVRFEIKDTKSVMDFLTGPYFN